MKLPDRLLFGCLAACMLVGSSIVRAEDSVTTPSGNALLRCDPGLVVLSIDGDKKRRVSANDLRNDCNVPLPRGKHELVAKFDWRPSDSMFGWEYYSPNEERLDLEVTENHIYRLKGAFEPTWRAWIDDVTSQERALPSHDHPRKGWAESLPVGQRTSVVIMKLTPTNTFVATYYGRTQGPWFLPGKYVPVYIKNKDWARDDYAIGEVEAGANLGITHATINGNSFGLDKQWGHLCGETLAPVFENLAGGKAYFLGNFSFVSTPAGLVAQFTQNDLQAARDFLRSRRPDLAAELEPAAYRMVRRRVPCEVVPLDRRWQNFNPESVAPLDSTNSPAVSAR